MFNFMRRQAGNSKKKKRHGGMSGAFGVFNEMFAPTTYSTQLIVEAQKEAGKPLPSPEDKLAKDLEAIAKLNRQQPRE